MIAIAKTEPESAPLGIRVRSKTAAARLRDLALALILVLEAVLFLVAANDLQTFFAMLNSAASCWSGRIGHH